MRLLMYQRDGEVRPGLLHNSQVVDLRSLAGDQTPPDLLGLIDQGPGLLRSIRQKLESATVGYDLDAIRLRPPLNPPRGNVVAIGRNYLEHARESARARGEEMQRPTVFTKAQTSINGPDDDVVLDRSITKEADWEVELGVVLGRRALNVPAEKALDYVFGYTVVNDVSARDIQFGWGGQFFKGKSLDGFCPIGPWIVTADEIPDPQNLRLTLAVNGTTKQDANTRDMIFPVRELIAQLSQGMTLLPGTLIATGTPEGVGFGREPAEYLQVGDLMESTVEGIGTLRNRMVDSR